MWWHHLSHTSRCIWYTLFKGVYYRVFHYLNVKRVLVKILSSMPKKIIVNCKIVKSKELINHFHGRCQTISQKTYCPLTYPTNKNIIKNKNKNKKTDTVLFLCRNISNRHTKLYLLDDYHFLVPE